jgi:acyl-CoA thioester hydrolase
MQPSLNSTTAIQPSIAQPIGAWFEYPVRVHPHHTDCAGIVWHGSYIAWMEEARIECLRLFGIDYADLVAMGCELPVVELNIRYHRSLRFGMTAIVKARMSSMDGVRINWDYQIQSADAVEKPELFVTAQVTLVAIDRDNGKIMRQLPPRVKEVLAKIAASG